MSTKHAEIPSREAFWSRVDAALDARRDPLADECIVAWLGERPDDAAALAELLARLDGLGARAPRSAARSRPAVRSLPLAAATVVAALAVWVALSMDESPARHAAPARTAAEPFDPRAFRVEHCTIEVVTRTPESVRTTRVADGVIEHSVATTTRGAGAPLATVVTRTRRTPPQESYP